MERCPVCQCRLKGATVCPRCGASLSLAIQSAIEAGRLIHRAMNAFEQGDLRTALYFVEQSLFIKRSTLGLMLREFFTQRQDMEAKIRRDKRAEEDKARQEKIMTTLQSASSSLLILMRDLIEEERQKQTKSV